MNKYTRIHQQKTTTWLHPLTLIMVLPGVQLSHVGGDLPSPVPPMSKEPLEAQALHQLMEDVRCANGVKPCRQKVSNITPPR